MTGLKSCILLLGQILVVVTANIHVPTGRLRYPPERSTMWREGYDTPKNIYDDWISCGGIYGGTDVRHQDECGVCGDMVPDPSPRQNEAGGIYGKGIIVGTYQKGQDITATIEMTNPEPGYSEFRICPTNDPNKIAKHTCMDKHLLKLRLADGTETTRFYMPKDIVAVNISITMQLPSNLTCSHCVFQWLYTTYQDFDGLGLHAVYSWTAYPENAEGTYFLMGCADINITADCTTGTFEAAGEYIKVGGQDAWCQHHCLLTPPYCPDTHCRCSTTTTAPSTTTTTPTTTTTTPPTPTTTPSTTTTSGGSDGTTCKAAGAWTGQASMDAWCQTNCPACPATHCACST